MEGLRRIVESAIEEVKKSQDLSRLLCMLFANISMHVQEKLSAWMVVFYKSLNLSFQNEYYNSQFCNILPLWSRISWTLWSDGNWRWQRTTCSWHWASCTGSRSIYYLTVRYSSQPASIVLHWKPSCASAAGAQNTLQVDTYFTKPRNHPSTLLPSSLLPRPQFLLYVV